MSAYCQTYQKSLNDVFTKRCLNILKEECLNTNSIFGKCKVHNISLERC